MNNKIKMEGDKVISIEPLGRNLAPHTSMAPSITRIKKNIKAYI